ncbi:hypothetical protein A3D11_02505 [Candidatus Peribacteria bacterium RIFCSPHIGHO2_02_FULL_49_16]|nr:MAG: hypothetical protein A2880_02055 [Candidatus Peribacteria bacterium RIFCSPHIGHO2_01_FULL_49_38]OGJ58470.1 MAG: hypothetical protein A3D11_02505 [Candidatus Peribacteria bacterium RIFCSPHIGHO2_02_FULL_49_16]
MKKYILIGNYGVGNLGDEALKEYFLRTFPEVQWQVLSAHPSDNEYHRLPCGVRSFFSTSWWKTLGVLWRCDGVVFGGGSLFTDSESVRACVLWWIHACIVRFFHKPIHLAFQGIGPFHTMLGTWCARWILRRVMTVSVRDILSEERVLSFQLNTEIVLSFDPIYKEILLKETERSQNVFTIIPRKNSPKAFWNMANEYRESQTWDDVRVVYVQEEHCPFRDVTVFCVDSLDDLSRRIEESSFVFAQRYHGALVALALGVPFSVLPQSTGDKLEALIREQRVGREEVLRRIERGEKLLRQGMCFFTS